LTEAGIFLFRADSQSDEYAAVFKSTLLMKRQTMSKDDFVKSVARPLRIG
jgi:hypothetical protein